MRVPVTAVVCEGACDSTVVCEGACECSCLLGCL